MTTTQTYIDPSGKLFTYKKFVNWEGYREVEGSGTVMAINDHTAERLIVPINSRIVTIVFTDFTIQD